MTHRDHANSADFCFVIPAYNEQETVGQIVRDLQALYPSAPVLVVDDASTDATREVAALEGAIVLPMLCQLGPWGASQAGIRFALESGMQRVITLDADGQHPATMVSRLISAAKATGGNIVIGACPERGTVLRRIAWRLMRLCSGLTVEDLTSGFRLYDRAAMELVASDRATYLDHQDIGVLCLSLGHGLSIVDVEVEMVERASGPSRIFSSWAKVARYMVYTLVLGLSKQDLQRFRVPLVRRLRTS